MSVGARLLVQWAGAIGFGLLCGACSSVTADSEPVQSRIAYLNSTGNLPSGLPFSEAVRVDNLLFLSGQIGSIPGEAKLVPGGIAAETKQTMRNIERVLKANGYGFDDVVKCTVMLADMKEWPAFNSVYRTFFANHFPARSAFGATGLAYDARVEIECIAAH